MKKALKKIKKKLQQRTKTKTQITKKLSELQAHPALTKPASSVGTLGLQQNTLNSQIQILKWVLGEDES